MCGVPTSRICKKPALVRLRSGASRFTDIAVLCKSRGADDQARRHTEAAVEHIRQTEECLHNYLDAWLALRTIAASS